MQENQDLTYQCNIYNEVISSLSFYNKESILHVLTYCLYLVLDKLTIERANGLLINNISLNTQYRFIDGRYNSITFLKYGILKHKYILISLLYLYKACLSLNNTNESKIFDFIDLFNLIDKIGKLFESLFLNNLTVNETTDQLNDSILTLARYVSVIDQQSQIQFNWEQGLNKVARSHLWFNTIPNLLSNRGINLSFDISNYYRTTFNLNLKQFLLLLTMIYTILDYETHNMLNKDSLYNIELREPITDEEKTTIFNLLIKDINNYQQMILRNRATFSPSSNTIDDTFIFLEPNPLYLTPIIDYNETTYFLPCSNFIVTKAFNGLYFDIFDSLTRDERNNYLDTFGIIFEEYIGYLLRNAFMGSNVQIKPEITYQEEGNEHKSSDWFILKDDKIIIFECKYATYSVRNKIVPDVEVTKKYFKDNFIKASHQLVKTEHNIITQTYPEFVKHFPHNYSKIYKVIVIAEPLMLYAMDNFHKLFKQTLNNLNNSMGLEQINYNEIIVINIDFMECLLSLILSGGNIFEIFSKLENNMDYKAEINTYIKENNITYNPNLILQEEINQITGWNN